MRGRFDDIQIDSGNIRGQMTRQPQGHMDQLIPLERTPSAAGAGLGTIPAGVGLVNLTAVADANHILVLPAPVVGHQVDIINNTGTGFELRTSAPATIGINGGMEANAETAFAATALLIHCKCISATQWIVMSHVAAGTYTAAAAAAAA